MARVPIYKPQVDLAPLPNARAPTVRSDLGQAGGEIGQAGAAIGDVAKREQEARNADRIMQAEAQMRDDYLKYETSLRTRRGQNAWGVTNDVASWFDTNGKTYLEGLENDAQRTLFKPTLLRTREQSVGSASSYEAQERRVSLEESAKASIASSVNLAAASHDNPEVVASAKRDVVNRVGVQAGFNGWDEARKTAEMDAELTNFHKQVIQSMADKNPDGARAYYDTNKGEIAGAARDEIEKVVELGGIKVKSQRVSDELVAKGLSESETLKLARDGHEGAERDAIVDRVKQRFADEKAAQDHREKEVADAAWNIFARTGKIDSIPVALYSELDGRTIQAMESAARQERVTTDWDTYQTLKDQSENDFATFKTVDLRKYVDALAPAQLKWLIDRQSKPAVTPDIATLEQQLSTAHNLLKFTKPEQKGRFDAAVQTALADAQNAKGDKKLTYDERQAVIDKMMGAGEVRGGGLFGLYDPDKRFYEVAGTDDAAKFVPDKQPTQAGAPPVVHTDADYDALPKGTTFVDTEGKRWMKP